VADVQSKLQALLETISAEIHRGHAPAVRARRARVLDAACTAHSERFVSKPPASPKLPGASWINPPQEKETSTQ
jgi:hypothetical protein